VIDVGKPLEGVRVVDLSQLTSGPLATMVLAEQGADVVKVEPPGLGDIFRLSAFHRGGFSALVLNHNRGKRGIAVDTGTDAGRALVVELMRGADVVVQNFRPGVVDRLGFGYDDIKAINPGVVYASISGYGPTGPYATRPVVDPIIQALTGIVARQKSEAIPLPDLVRNIIVDKATALTVAQSICAALFQRERTGEGDHLVIPMLDVGAYFFWPDGMMDHTLVGEGVTPGLRIADTYVLTQCADGQLIYYAPTNDMRLALYRTLGHPELCDDPRFNTAAGLIEGGHFEQLGLIITEEFAKRTVEEILSSFVEAGIPVAPILEPEEVWEDEQIVHNGTLVEWEHPQAGRLRQPRHPVRFASAETPVPESVPGLGEHTDEILAELGRTPEQIQALRASGAVT
jgi:crotonobetainyl-CoA:carnitine CoA-transferase CaiB-like acyl-CoA transferase